MFSLLPFGICIYNLIQTSVCVRARACVIESLRFVAHVHIYISKTFTLCKGMQCQLEMCVLCKLRHSKIPSVFLSLSLSLSFLQLHCSLPNILLQPFWVFFDLRCTNFFYGQLLNLYVFITTNCVLGIFYFVNEMVLIILMN